MARYFLFGTLMWDALLHDVAGEDAGIARATLEGWSVERSEAGDWPVLIPGGTARGYVTADLSDAAKARLDWYETAFGYVPEAVTVTGPDGPVAALVYRASDGAGGSGEGWHLTDWVATHGTRTRLAAGEVMRAMGRMDTDTLAARRGWIQARAHATAMTRAYHRPVTVGGGPMASDIDLREVTQMHEGFLRTETLHLTHPRFDGTTSDPMDREVVTVTDAATVLPYDPVRDRVLLVEQIRLGALAKGDPRPWMLEPVAGIVDAGETPESTAIRETREEAGLTIGPSDLQFIGRYYPSPGTLAQILYSYVAICDLPDGCDGLHGVASEHEDIRAHLVPLDDLLAMIPSTEAANAPLILSAQWIALNRARLTG